jgi:glycosyltransferase involved in cell wall biosynthesis
MIVKDEALVIERCLESVRGLISNWVICDTGSTDGTQELIERALAGVPGELHECPWIDFGHNRTELMGLARGKADYLLLLDADMTITVDRSGLEGLGADSYLLRHAEPLEYRIKRLVRGDRTWRYVGSTHEYIESEGPETLAALDAIVVHHHGDGGTRKDKFTRDLRLLEGELAEDEGNTRALFYLAQTHRDLGHVDDAIELYSRRSRMGGWEEEVFYSLYQVGVLKAQAGDWSAAVPALLDAWNYRPSRVEPLYHLALGYRNRSAHQAAYLFALRGVDRPRPKDVLFVEAWIYRWAILFELSISAFYVGAVKDAIDAGERLLRIKELPSDYRAQAKRNLQICQDARRPSEQAAREQRFDVSTRREPRPEE